MKKKLISLLIALLLTVSLIAACDNGTDGKPETPGTEVEETNQQTSEPEQNPEDYVEEGTYLTQETIAQVTDPQEFVALYIKALREGDAAGVNMLYGKKQVETLTADPSLEKYPFSDSDNVTRIYPVADGYVVSEEATGSEVYFVREGNCIGYTCYIRNTGSRFVMVATAKYAFEFAECAAEDYSLFPYTEDFRIAPDDKTLSERFPAELLTEIITSALKKGDIWTLKTLCKDMTFDEPQHAEGEPTPVNRAPFGYAGPAADVICKPENDTTVFFEVKTLDGNTVNLTATLKKDGDGYMLSTLTED